MVLRKSLPILLLLLVFAAGGVGGSEPSPVLGAQSAFFPIAAINPNPESDRGILWQCTGFNLVYGLKVYGVTAGHCVYDPDDETSKRVGPIKEFENLYTHRVLKVLYYSDEVDVALIEADPDATHLALGAPEQPEDPIACNGMIFFYFIDPKRAWNKGEVIDPQFSLPLWGWQDLDLTSCRVRKGFSGGPVISLRTGDVIGVNVGMFSDLSFFLSINREGLVKALENAQKSLEQSPDSLSGNFQKPISKDPDLRKSVQKLPDFNVPGVQKAH